MTDELNISIKFSYTIYPGGHIEYPTETTTNHRHLFYLLESWP